jgi:hypothetical protein
MRRFFLLSNCRAATCAGTRRPEVAIAINEF